MVNGGLAVHIVICGQARAGSFHQERPLTGWRIAPTKPWRVAEMKNLTQRVAALALGPIVLTLACSSTFRGATQGSPPSSLGEQLYGQHCAACHGEQGLGDGPAAPFLAVRPRNFQEERIHFVSTAEGRGPAQGDVAAFIRRGSRATHMPAHPQLASSEVSAIADYIRALRLQGVAQEVQMSFEEEGDEVSPQESNEIAAELLAPGQQIAFSAAPQQHSSDLARGAEIFAAQCASCHGPGGLGDGPEELRDDLGRIIYARNLTRGEYRGGGRDRDLFWRIRCGIPGTPMPAFDENVVAGEDLWHLIAYVRGLSQLQRGNLR